MVLKKVGYYIVKKKCVKVYQKKTRNRSGRMVTKKVNYKGKVIKKGTKIYKTKANCLKALKKKMDKKSRTRRTRRTRKTRKTRSTYKFGDVNSPCYYSLPYFGNMVPSIAKTWSGTNNTGISSSSWKWPKTPGAKQYDMLQGGWNKM